MPTALPPVSAISRLKRLARSGAESLTSGVAPWLFSLRPASSLVVLMYHRVLPRSHPEWRVEQPGMLLAPESLDLHLALLRDQFEMVHLDDWLEARAAGNPLPRRACAITFDDGWQDNYEYAFPLLQKHGTPATIFLVTDLVGGRYRFWPNRLGHALHRLDDIDALADWPAELASVVRAAIQAEDVSWPLDAAAVDRAVAGCKKGFNDSELHALIDEVEAPSGELPRDLLDWSEIAAMSNSGLIRFGSHTCRHTRLLQGLPDESIRHEVGHSRRVIEEHLNRPCTLFCYPNGNKTDRAEKIVKDHYQGAVLTESGWNSRAVSPFRIRRVGLHEGIAATAPALLSRLAGLP